MNTVNNHELPEESINNHERGFRTVVGCAAIAVLLSSFVSTEVEIFAVSLLTVYAMFTAIMGVDIILDPLYNKFMEIARGLKGGVAGGSRDSFA